MTTEEAQKIIETIMKADGGCPNCARSLGEDFIKDFPEFEKEIRNTYKKTFPDKCDEWETRD